MAGRFIGQCVILKLIVWAFKGLSQWIWKESLNNGDGQQFHQYKQYKQYKQNGKKTIFSPQITEHKKTKTFDVGNPGPGLGQAQKCGGDKTING